MARAGLAEPSLLRAAVADGGTVARFRATIAVVPGSGCEYWTSAISGRGHGRFRVGEVAGRDVMVIAHRFAWALEHRVDALEQVLVLGHRCDNPLGQQIGDGHVRASSHCSTGGSGRCIVTRSVGRFATREEHGALCISVRREPTALSLAAGETLGAGFDAAHLPLWDEQLSCCEFAQMKDAGRGAGPQRCHDLCRPF
jgi:hypothetical protein